MTSSKCCCGFGCDFDAAEEEAEARGIDTWRRESVLLQRRRGRHEDIGVGVTCTATYAIGGVSVL
jgi:hypothetical protein